MKTDKYLKVVLTVIAISLVILVLQNANIISTVKAGNEIPKTYATIPVNADGTINVSVKSFAEMMDVNIKQVGGSTVYESIPIIPKGGDFDVNIKEVGGSSVYKALPIIPEGSIMDINVEQVGGFKVYSKIPVENN